jgi:hypothetical protein
MKNRNYILLFSAMFFVLLCSKVSYGQLCDEAGNAKALNTQTNWVLDYRDVPNKNWVTAIKPILAEMQRVFPQPPKGLSMRNSVFSFIDLEATPNEVHRYQGYFVIRNLVCNRMSGMNRIQPKEGPESNVYFTINEMPSNLADEFEHLRTGDYRIVENPNGIKTLYNFNEKGEQEFMGWYFSENKGLPFRRLSKGELAQKFREYWVKKLDYRIKELETMLANTEKNIAEIAARTNVSAKQNQELIQAIRKADVERKKDLATAKAQREDCLRRTDAITKSPDAKSDARVTMALASYETAELDEKFSRGQYVMVENKDFFDKKLPKWQPQFILASMLRVDNSEAQIAFNNKFENEFDFNVLRKMVGMSPMAKAVTISGMGGTVGSEPDKKTETPNVESANGVMFSEDFSNAALEQKPPRWTVSNDTATVKNIEEQPGKWLALKKEGLFYPDFSLLVLPSKFTLEFDVSWNKNISYNSPNFVFHIGEAPYDNTLKSYDKEQINQSMEMNRIELWLDPHWNSAGRYGFTRYNNRGGYIKEISDKTSAFYKQDNRVRVKIVRDGARMTVYLNDKTTLQDPKIALDENIRWNFFGFGLWGGGNADAMDEFYLSNIRLTKQ